MVRMLMRMLMIMVEHFQGGDRVRAPPARSWRQPAGSPRDVRTRKRINLTLYLEIFLDTIWEIEFPEVILKPSKCKTIKLLARYVAQQCSQPVSLLGDQKGLRMIKVTYFLGIFERKILKQLLIKTEYSIDVLSTNTSMKEVTQPSNFSLRSALSGS